MKIAVKPARWMLLSVPAFFGLTPEYKIEYQMEQLFLSMVYLGMSYVDAYRLPIQYRVWYIKRLQKEMDKQAAANADGNSTTRPSYENMPQQRAMSGRGIGRQRF